MSRRTCLYRDKFLISGYEMRDRVGACRVPSPVYRDALAMQSAILAAHSGAMSDEKVQRIVTAAMRHK